jgi:uncharacterized DUF497 family protein
MVKVEFDPKKDQANREKHGVSLGIGNELDWNTMLVQVDDAENYGEDRWIGIAPKDDRLYTAVYAVLDDETVRMVSLRLATNAEIERYERQNQPQGKIQAKQRRRRSPRKGRHKGRS